ncbi:MAG: hypothetical protein CVT64_10570 [Actinobacteria bacterium HGW-Actinobacteria-4]|nr:MAG: hypothetical protein CVT64_10570 [Actinobacteria bacterium HGW-Actinobacteria-4]
MSGATRAWAAFDELVKGVDTSERSASPWRGDASGGVQYEPDFELLRKLLGVPLALRAPTTSGVPALALDVWVAHELRRAGVDSNAVWPRASKPRVMPGPVASLLEHLPAKEALALRKRLSSGSPPRGVVGSRANILGKNYLKQVDVVVSDWATGPEVLISTKRMDSSFGNNAANRIEESYGDAKNLRLRHPMAALGFFYGLRSTIFDEAPEKADWLIDLLQKLGREDDAYHAVALLVVEYGGEGAPPLAADDEGDGDDVLQQAMSTLEDGDDGEDDGSATPTDLDLATLPRVDFKQELVPPDLQPSHFLQSLVERLLRTTPINFHREARVRRTTPL